VDKEETINSLINNLLNKVRSKVNNKFINEDLVTVLEDLKNKSNNKQLTIKDLVNLFKIYRNLIIPGMMIQEIQKLEALKSFIKNS